MSGACLALVCGEQCLRGGLTTGGGPRRDEITRPVHLGNGLFPSVGVGETNDVNFWREKPPICVIQNDDYSQPSGRGRRDRDEDNITLAAREFLPNDLSLVHARGDP